MGTLFPKTELASQSCQQGKMADLCIENRSQVWLVIYVSGLYPSMYEIGNTPSVSQNGVIF